MSPVSGIKQRQFAFVLTAEEHRMLQALAKQDARSAAGWIRFTIQSEYAAKFGEKPKKKR